MSRVFGARTLAGSAWKQRNKSPKGHGMTGRLIDRHWFRSNDLGANRFRIGCPHRHHERPFESAASSLDFRMASDRLPVPRGRQTSLRPTVA